MGHRKGTPCVTKGMPHWSDARYLAKLKSKTQIDANGCWLFTGALMPTGYADMCYRGKNMRAHRLMHMLAKGPLGDLHVMHSCDVRHCVNPDHLSLGTNEQNIHDALRKGRPHRGNLMSAKTHCPAGHDYAESARWEAGRRGVLKRACKTCQRVATRRKAGWPAHLWNLPPQPLGHKPQQLIEWQHASGMQRGTNDKR